MRILPRVFPSLRIGQSTRVPLVWPILSAVLFTLYSVTACPTVYPGDSGELIAAAFSLGIPHNSGYPLYSMLGKAASLLPLGSLGYRLNLFSSLAVAAAMALVYQLVQKRTGSRMIALSVALFLSFTPKVWNQSASAEVYGLHLVFVIVLVFLLFEWDREPRWWRLALLAVIAGLSFGHHLQTVMLGPAVLFVVLARDKAAVFRPKHFVLLALLFCIPLALYACLPVRTNAGAAITWGNPDSWERFLAHVTATSHRHGYVFNQTVPEYLSRAAQTLSEIWTTFGPLLLLAAWGWWRTRERRWKVFYLLVFVFDLFYTVFLNSVSLEVTPFSLPTWVALTLLLGDGIFRVRSSARARSSGRVNLDRFVLAGLLALPAIPLASNLDRCDQSGNYTAYEHAVNMFRTLDAGDALVLSGDNHVFPAAYGRIVERMGGWVQLYDHYNIIFHLPEMRREDSRQSESWEDRRNDAEAALLASRAPGQDLYYAVFSAYSISLPEGRVLEPVGVLHEAMIRDRAKTRPRRIAPWPYYAMESIQNAFFKDYMTREICAFYYFAKGTNLFRRGRPSEGLANLKLASRIGYDDHLVHSELGVFLTDQGLYEDALKELKIANLYHDNIYVIHNNWGYYYHKIGCYGKAAASFRRALELRPGNVGDHNNLGFALYEMGNEAEALKVLKRSLALDPDQPMIRKFIRNRLGGR